MNMNPNYPLTFTFVLTQGCQLACKYCYLVGKNNQNRMSFDTAKTAVVYLINNRNQFPQDRVVFDFIGGEPLLEIELMDKICDYIKTELFAHNHPWFSNYNLNVSTNGLLYSDSRVQNFILKNKNALSLTISIDGNKSKHDSNRIYTDGRGSYDDVVKQIPKWLKDFPNASTKVTISSPDIPFLAESIIHLFDLGIHTVNSNTVYEDVWQDGDDRCFEDQLIKLADIMIEKGYYKNYTCSLFDEFIGKPVNDNNNWCGSGMAMLAIDSKGILYPCIRFMDFSLENKEPRSVGNVYDGIDFNKLRPFLALNRECQSSKECMECEVASGCAWCTGHNYDASKTGSIYERATAICKMHKARVRAKNYFWEKIKELNK